MAESIIAIVENEIKPGKADQLKMVYDQIIEHCKPTEPDTISYAVYFNAERTQCRTIEQYKNIEALMFHVANYAKFEEAMSECREIKKVNVFGKVNDEVKQSLAAVSGIVFEPVASWE